MEIGDLGARLRARRAAAGETISAVAMRAGLSVPYIANLENGRGNPTLTALSALASALGTELVVELADQAQGADADRRPGIAAAASPASLARFARTARFGAEAELLAERSGRTPVQQRELLLRAMSGVAAAAAPLRSLTELDWHRVLDSIVLVSGGSHPGEV